MIIEFTGVPCSGKSDISHEFAEILRKKGFSVCENQYELSHGENSKKRAVKKAVACILYCIRHPKRAFAFYRLIGSVTCWMNYVYLLSHNCKKEICILEQGYLQLIGSFFDNAEPDAGKMDLLFKSLVPKKDIVSVFVSLSKETILKRVSMRKDKPFFAQSNSPDAALDYALETNEQLKQLWLKNKGESRFVSVSNEKDNSQSEVAKAIFDIMKQKEIL